VTETLQNKTCQWGGPED